MLLIEASSAYVLNYSPQNDVYYIICGAFNFMNIVLLMFVGKNLLSVDMQFLCFLSLIGQFFGFISFKSLLPSRPLEVGKVVTSNATGCYVTLPAGGTMYVRGNAAVGTNVFVRDGVIEGAAPNLTVQSIDV